MARITVEDCLEKVENRFALVLLVSKRAKQLLKGARPALPPMKENKYIVNALREVAVGKVHYDPGAVSQMRHDLEKDLNS